MPRSSRRRGRRPLALSALVAGVLAGLLGPAAQAAPVALPPLRSAVPGTAQAVLGPDGAWCWFSDPRSVHVRGRTFTGYVTSTGDIVVSAYNHATRAWDRQVLMSRFEVDDHDNPSLLVHRDGRLSVFWSGHARPELFVRTTSRPGDIRSFGPLRRVAHRRLPGDTLVTYTNPVRVPSEHDRIYLFYRSQYTHQAYTTSDDDGRTWSDARVAVEQPRERPYVKYDQDLRTGSIAMAFTDGHPDATRTSIYFASLRRSVAHHADGSLIAPMGVTGITPAQADLVWSGRDVDRRGWVHDVAYGQDGLPVVVFASLDPQGLDHRYEYARFDGAHWQVHEMARAGGTIATQHRERYYSGGVTLDHRDPSIAYLAVPGTRPGVDEIVRWTTPDGGRTATVRPVTAGSSMTNVRPVVPRGLPAYADGQVVFMSGTYPHFTSYRTTLHAAAAPVRPPR